MTDAELLERLTGALTPTGLDTAPPPGSVAVVLAAVHEASMPAPPAPRRLPLWWARKVAAAGAALAVVGGGAGVAFAAGAPIPAAVRDVAHDAGLPVDSSTAVAARGAIRALSDAEDHGNATSIAARAEALQALLARLDRDERQDLARASARALDAAAQPSRGAPSPGGHLTPDPSVPASGAPAVTPPAHDGQNPTPKPDPTTPAPNPPNPPTPSGPPGPAQPAPKPHGEPTPPPPAHRG